MMTSLNQHLLRVKSLVGYKPNAPLMTKEKAVARSPGLAVARHVYEYQLWPTRVCTTTRTYNTKK